MHTWHLHLERATERARRFNSSAEEAVLVAIFDCLRKVRWCEDANQWASSTILVIDSLLVFGTYPCTQCDVIARSEASWTRGHLNCIFQVKNLKLAYLSVSVVEFLEIYDKIRFCRGLTNQGISMKKIHKISKSVCQQNGFGGLSDFKMI